MTGKSISRREVLRGFGTALALPALEGFLPLGLAARIERPPTRLVYVYVPNGVHLEDWWPQQEGALDSLPQTLEPLEPFKEEVSVLGGLASAKARANGDGPGDHARASATWLTGVQPLKAAGEIGLGVSADQVAAKSIGGATRFRSLQLGCEKGGNSGQCDSGYSCAYSSNISWQSAKTPASKEVNPRVVFDRLFRGGSGPEARRASVERLRKRKSLLDFVKEDEEGLRLKLGLADRQKIDEYFTGIRELERRMVAFEEEAIAGIPDSARPTGSPKGRASHIRLMADLAVLAFQADVTRVVTFMFANEGSNRPHRQLGISEGHHTLSHHGGDLAKREKIRKIDHFYVSQLAYLLGRLQGSAVGEGNLLDHTMLVYGSNIGDGNAHNHDDLPTLLCGRGSGKLSPGKYVRFPNNPPLMNLHLSLLGKMGVSLSALGDSTGRLNI